MDDAQKQEVEEVIQEYIEEKIDGLKTKGGQLFRRFYENEQEKFRKFRKLNADENNAALPEFQELGRDIEDEMFKLE